MNDVSSIDRALGVQWVVESDAFTFRIVLKDQPLTRRGILSTVSSVYDPLGIVAPVILVGKQILQQMCREQTDWDDPVPDENRPQWEQWRPSLFNVRKLELKRCFKPSEFGKVKVAEVHRVCSYIRVVNE